jgi:chemotaxis protein histidine kinase CheA/ActR/RegA family two-component response regulator
MNIYPANLFEIWPGDETLAQLSTDPRVLALFRGLYERACHELAWLGTTAKSIKHQEDEDVFAQLYRRNHVLCGFAAMLELPKGTHLLTLLDFAFDYARDIETFERHSLDYVVQLLIDTTQEVFDHFASDGCCQYVLAAVLEECRTYLYAPFQQYLEPPPPADQAPPSEAPADMAATPSTVVLPDPAAAGVPVVVSADSEVDDEPEALDIPVENIGLVSDFCEECREMLGQIGYQLVALEDSDVPLPMVHDLFRAVHTVKGGARLLKIRKIETLTHQLESLLDQVRHGVRAVHADLIDVLLEGKKLLENMVDEVASRGPIRTRIGPCVRALMALQQGTALVPRPPAMVPAPTPAALPIAQTAVQPGVPAPLTAGAPQPKRSLDTESIRVSTDKLDAVLNTASEVFITRIRLQNDVAALGGVLSPFKHTLGQMQGLDAPTILNRLGESNHRLRQELRVLLRRQNGHLRPERLDALVNRFYDELEAEIARQGYSVQEEITLNLLSLEEITQRLLKDIEHLEQLSVHLQTSAMNFRMVPLAHLFDHFPIQVREMGRGIGKKVRLEVSGAETELDKVLVHHLADPLLHLLRNAVDHGIEPAEERLACGKPETGRIVLRAYYHGSHAVIEVVDDGRGIDVHKVLAKALEGGLVEAERAASLREQEILELIFAPGFSTAEQVSMLSGRGVGMDVVKTAMSQVQGTITIESVPHQGTMVRMKLPLTLAVVGILLVEEDANQFAFPSLAVEDILTIEPQHLQGFSHNIVYNHQGRTLPVTTLSTILGFPPSAFADDRMLLVVLAEGEKKIGVLVDRVLDRQEALIKNLGSLIKQVPFVMGCTILSDSRLVLLLNASEIINTKAQKPVLTLLGKPDQQRNARHALTILIVEDSPIQRKNLRAILTHAGYRVETANNGFEGLKRVRHKRYTAFCVDIAMPLMDGFEFVERLRHTPDHQDTPVFLITSYTTHQERDRAARLGVNEFLAKPVDADVLVALLDTYCLSTAAARADTMPVPVPPAV